MGAIVSNALDYNHAGGCRPVTDFLDFTIFLGIQPGFYSFDTVELKKDGTSR
jgi:hypothetical protein